MRKFKFLILFTIIYSCKSDPKPELKFESSYGMYTILINEFNFTTLYIEKEIQEQKNSLNLNDTLISDLLTYDTLTKEYVIYLDNLTEQLINEADIGNNYENQQTLTEIRHINKLFFKDREYSLKGTEYIDKTDSYRELILKLVKDQNLTDRIKGTIDTRDIRDRNSNSIKSLDYIFKDQSLIGTIAYLKNRKKNVLEFEKEFFNKNKPNK